MMSLLIVDDEMRIADSLYAMIQDAFQERLAVRRCYSAAEAQALMEKTPVNILLTDINMPNISGLELHRWVSGRWPMTRVIYLTGYSDFEYEFQLAAANEFAAPEIDMVFFMARKDENFVSSSSVNELRKGGVDVSSLVPPCVINMFEKKGL